MSERIFTADNIKKGSRISFLFARIFGRRYGFYKDGYVYNLYMLRNKMYIDSPIKLDIAPHEGAEGK